MNTPIGTIPRFETPCARVGRASELLPRRESEITVKNVAVRSDDFDAFLGVIRARENLVGDRFGSHEGDARFGKARMNEIASFALAAGECCHQDRGATIARLQTAAALAITAIADLERARK